MSVSVTLSGFASAFNRARPASVVRASIDSQNAIVAAAVPLVLGPGEVRKLTPGTRLRVLSGRVWLTHRDDGRDWFPRPGELVEAGPASVIEAWSGAVLVAE